MRVWYTHNLQGFHRMLIPRGQLPTPMAPASWLSGMWQHPGPEKKSERKTSCHPLILSSPNETIKYNCNHCCIFLLLVGSTSCQKSSCFQHLHVLHPKKSTPGASEQCWKPSWFEVFKVDPKWATKKTLLLSIESWLVNRDPYNGLLKSLYNWVGFHPIYNPTNQGPFFRCSNGFRF